MKHYDYIEWVLYKSKALSQEKHNEMEEHLCSCDDCMEIFLSLIGEEEIVKAQDIIPIDFNDRVLKQVENIIPIKKQVKNKNMFNYQFGYYVAIASLTIFLTIGGYFSNLVDAVPKISLELEMNRNMLKPNRIYDFSEKIVDKTSKFISSIENIEEREIRRSNNER